MVWISVVSLLCLGMPIDDGDQDFPPVYNSDRDADAAPMSPALAVEQMQVPNGLSVGVFAAEPDVQNPIAAAWGADGGLWVAENYTYAERSQRFDLNLRDRVIVLEDTTGDGKADQRTVFTDEVQMLTGIEVGHGGVWLMCPPRLLFIPDQNEDRIPDGQAQTILDGFEVAAENYHNFANGLRWGPDGWLYGRCGGSCPGLVGKPGTPPEQRIPLEGGVWRMHPRSQRFEVLTHGTTNPWGHDWNQWGQGFFINTVNGHLWHLIPGAHCHRPFTLDPNPYVYQLLDMHADHWHFDTGAGWTKSRDGAANDYGGGHAHVGMLIYQGNNWPEQYHGRLLTWNIHGRRANQEILERRGSGYVGRHAPDLLNAGDPFFRGMELLSGYDGAIYALDWSDTGECHEHTGVHRTSGRIYRIAAAGDVPSPLSAGVPRTPVAWTGNFQHPNRLQRRMAALRLAGATRSDSVSSDVLSAVGALRQQLVHRDPVVVSRAAFALHACEMLTRNELNHLTRHRREEVRAQAVALIADNWPIDAIFGPTADGKAASERVRQEYKSWESQLLELANDESSLVRLSLASLLQRLPSDSRLPLARELMQHAEDAEDHNLPLLVWYGLIPVAESHSEQLVDLALQTRWPLVRRFIARRISEHPESPAFRQLVKSCTYDGPEQLVYELLEGIQDGLKGRLTAPMPPAWKAVRLKFSQSPRFAGIVRELSVVFGVGRAMDEVRALVTDGEAEANLRRSALQTLARSSDPQKAELCRRMLNDPRFNVTALEGLRSSADSGVADDLIANYRRFRAPYRPLVVSLLLTRAVFAERLLQAVAANRIPASDLTAYDVRQIRNLNVPSLNQEVARLWGEVRESSAEKRRLIATLKGQLADSPPASARELYRGRQLFQKTCAKCHRLYGDGEAIGPDLTGANRADPDYLLENIIDPGAVVSVNYRMTVVQLEDGRVLSGLVVSESESSLVLQTQTEKLTISSSLVEERRTTAESPMPNGLLDNLSSEDTLALLRYLQHPTQVNAPE